MKGRSNILFVDHVPVIGGAERSLIDLSEKLKSRGYKCYFLLPADGELADRLREIGPVCIIYFSSWRWWDVHFWRFFFAIPLQVIAVVRILRLIRRLQPDIVHLNINRLVEPVVAARLAACKSIMHYRDIPSRVERKFVFGQRYFYMLMNLTTRWVANSRATFVDIIDHAKVKVYHVPNGIDIERFDLDLQTEESGISKCSAFKIVMIASITKWKNIEAYIQLAQLILQDGVDCNFYVAGDGTRNYKRSLQSMVNELGIANKFEFLGRVQPIAPLLRDVDLLVHTTIDEPFGRVFVEAMLAARPVVTFSGGGADEIVEHGLTGLLISPNKLDLMKDAVVGLVEDRERAKQMGKLGRERATNIFSLDKHVDSIEKIYWEVLENLRVR